MKHAAPACLRSNPRWIIPNPIAGFTAWWRAVHYGGGLFVHCEEGGGETLEDVATWFRKTEGAAGC